MLIELMRQFFREERIYRISDSMGKKAFAKFSNAMMYKRSFGVNGVTLRELMFDIDVVIQRENQYSRESINKTILQLWASGMFTGENSKSAVVAMKNMQFDGKERLIADLQALYGNQEVIQ